MLGGLVLIMSCGRSDASVDWSRFRGPSGMGVTPRHLGGSNALYTDGHAKTIVDIHGPNNEFYGYYAHKYPVWAWYDSSGSPQ